MKRVVTGVSLGLCSLFFVFLANEVIFLSVLSVILVISLFELIKHKKFKFISFWILALLILFDIYVLFIFENNLSRNFFFTALFIAAFTDIFSFFIGKLIGRNYLFPKISPNKTLEGFIAGIFITPIILILLVTDFLQIFPIAFINVHVLAASEFIQSYGFLSSFLVFTFCSTFSIFGDLLASKVKRDFKIKDFSNFLPGHGGFLDRIDSHILCIPTFYLFASSI